MFKVRDDGCDTCTTETTRQAHWPRSPLSFGFGFRPKQIPLIIWHRLRPLRMFNLLLNVLLFIYGTLIIGFSLDITWIVSLCYVRGTCLVGSRLMLLLPLILLLAWTVIGIARRMVLRQLRLAAKEHYRICLQCGYLLNQLPDEHHCPECGIYYDYQALRAAWLGVARNADA